MTFLIWNQRPSVLSLSQVTVIHPIYGGPIFKWLAVIWQYVKYVTNIVLVRRQTTESSAENNSSEQTTFVYKPVYDAGHRKYLHKVSV